MMDILGQRQQYEFYPATELNTKTEKPILYAIFVCAPIFLGLIIYILFRENLPSMLDWGLSGRPIRLSPNMDWFVYNLPDGLWAFGFMSFLVISCQSDSRKIRVFYYGLGFLVMIAIEIAQVDFISGTYDPDDLVAILSGALFSIAVVGKLVRR